MLTFSFVLTYDILKTTAGSDKILCWLANRLVDSGHKVQIVTPHRTINSVSFDLSQSVELIDYATGCLPFYLQPFLTRILACCSLIKGKRQFFRNYYARKRQAFMLSGVLGKLHNIDVIISMTPVGSIIIQEALKRVARRVPVITMVHSSFEEAVQQIYPHIKNKKWEQELRDDGLWTAHEKMVAYLAEGYAVQVLQPDVEQEFKRLMPKSRIVRIPNAVPQLSLPPTMVCKRQKKIVYVSRITMLKRQDLLIRAFFRIHKQFPDWRLEFWGSVQNINYSKSVRDLIEQLELSKQVFMCGVTPAIDLVLLSSSVFVMPSAREGFSLAMTEAMSAGLPVLGCTDAPGVRDLICNGENGILCEPTEEAMANALKQLLMQESLRQRLGEKAKESIRQYEPNKVWLQWETLLTDAAHSCKKGTHYHV